MECLLYDKFCYKCFTYKHHDSQYKSVHSLAYCMSPDLVVNKDYAAHVKGFMVGHLSHFFLYLFLLVFSGISFPFSAKEKYLRVFVCVRWEKFTWKQSKKLKSINFMLLTPEQCLSLEFNSSKLRALWSQLQIKSQLCNLQQSYYG